jgi:UTP:GlnB (protein PII) uridylyltransferase
MPPRYRQLFRGAVVNEHAAIVARREAAPAHAEIWRLTPQGTAIACMVADDHPWLLSFVCTALNAHAIHLLAAHLYARVSSQGNDLVCLLWLVREEFPDRLVVDADVARVAELVGGLVTGELTLEVMPPEARCTTPPDAATLIKFEHTGDPSSALLVVETHERPGLLRAVTGALLSTGVRIRKSLVASARDGLVVQRFFLAEPDGRAPDSHRRDILQADVLRAISAIVPRTARVEPSVDPTEEQRVFVPQGSSASGADGSPLRTISGLIPKISLGRRAIG